jgi:uncharacterized protein YutD
MDLQWTEIKSEIKRDVEDILLTESPSFTDIEKGFELFQKVIYADIQKSSLGGLASTLPQALQDAYISKRGDLSPLKILSDNLEPYLKKIAIIATLDNPNSILGTPLMPLLKLLNLNSALSSQVGKNAYPQLAESELQNYRGVAEYLYYLCDCYIIRNTVHLAPNMKRREVMEKIASLITIYLYAAFKYEKEIELIGSLSPSNPSISNKISSEQQYLYDFVSFGHSAYKVKQQIITSYLLFSIKNNDSTTAEEIQRNANAYFQNELPLSYYQGLISNLVIDGRVILSGKQINLSVEEVKRLDNTQANFIENRSIFFKLLEDLASQYLIIPHLSGLFDKLKEFIQQTYDVDLAEVSLTGELNKIDQNEAYHKFISYLTEILPDKSLTTNLFNDLLVLSTESDFLIRMCASNAFATLTNPDRFDQYVRQQEKIVYLDTQVVLHALCLNYLPENGFDNVYYLTVEELLGLSRSNKNIKFRISKPYLNEIAHQLKLALMLIPFESMVSGKISNNVFYLFYWHLKSHDLLNEDDETFADFMHSWFFLEQTDIYDPKFTAIVTNTLSDILRDDLNIDVELLPNYENKADAVDVILDVISLSEKKERPKLVISNDALMLIHLTNSDFHVMEPFFLTWDKLFTKYRKSYINKYHRRKIISFHLSSPARFINHFNLINLKINPIAIANDLLSFIETNDLQYTTQTIWDTVNRFTSIENISPTQRRKYISTMKGTLEKELNQSIEDLDELERTRRVVKPFEEMLDKINDFFQRDKNVSFYEYKRSLLDESFFGGLSDLISKYIGNPETTNNFITEFQSLLTLFREKKQ